MDEHFARFEGAAAEESALLEADGMTKQEAERIRNLEHHVALTLQLVKAALPRASKSTQTLLSRKKVCAQRMVWGRRL